MKINFPLSFSNISDLFSPSHNTYQGPFYPSAKPFYFSNNEDKSSGTYCTVVEEANDAGLYHKRRREKSRVKLFLLFKFLQGHFSLSPLHLGDLMDYKTVYHFGKQVDVLTIEIENVNVDALEAL